MNRFLLVLWVPVLVLGLLGITPWECEAFVLHPSTRCASIPHPSARPILVKGSHKHHYMIPPPTEFIINDVSSSTTDSFSSMILADESWRQYFSLLLIGGVLIDILLGSPLANMALKPLRGESQEQDEDSSNNKKKNASTINKSRERIDSEAVAKAAIERAQNALELKRFLEEKKTDWDRMEEMKRKLDAEMQELDADLKAREESLKRKSE